MHPSTIDLRVVRRGQDFFDRVDAVAETGSTNADLLALAANPQVEHAVLIADRQTSGRGRLGRVWQTAPGDTLAMSLLVRVGSINPINFGWLPLLAGLAVVDAVRGAAEVSASLKWPNDVLVNERKLAGILVELAPGPNPAAVIGIGLNTSLGVDDLPIPTATSLAIEVGLTSDRSEIAGAILREFARQWTHWQGHGWAVENLAKRYRERCATIGQTVRAQLPGGGEIVGTAVHVDSQGRLVIEAGNHVESVSAGDIVHVRSVS